MPGVHIILLMFVAVRAVDGLTCLQCHGVPQPRFCSKVVDCFDGEYCSTMKVLNEFGEHVYNLGCHTKRVCDNFTSTAKTCSECCGTSLCNAEACGEPGYPTRRGPVCYNCQVHTASGPCHDVDFCLEDETCNIVGRQLFSSEVLTSKCISKHACKEHNHAAIIGKRDVSMVKRTQQHTCDLCCDHDLCNRNCSTATSGTGPSVVNNCNTNPCGSHGTCVEGVNGYTCLCDIGYEGSNCQTNTDDCIQGLCGSHGTCIDGVNNYSCSCDSGFTGKHCLTNLDDCSSLPCASGGTCYDGDKSYTCICDPGFSGINCETNIDDCFQGLCGSHGTCIDGVNNYTCACASGFTGTNCLTRLDDCSSLPCASGGTCYDGDKTYTCICAPGFSGINCETDIDDCYYVNCGMGTCIDEVDNYTCACQSGYGGRHCQISVFYDCYDILHQGMIAQDGVYNITTWKTNRKIQVYCDMTTAGGGWTVFQNRFDGSVDFYRNLSQYESGFGQLSGEFWLGLPFIQEMTDERETEMRIDLEDAKGTRAYSTYSNFSLSGGNRYTLHVGRQLASSGLSGDSLLPRHNGQAFTTYDRDLDSYGANCAKQYHGAWWYESCHELNLNGLYLTPGTPNNGSGMVFESFTYGQSLKSSKMMFRKMF